MKRLLLCLALSGCIGACSNDLDRKQSRLRQDFGNTCTLFGVLTESREKAINTFAAQSFEQSKTQIESEWMRWLDSHTDEAGNLVSKRPDGTVAAMPASQLIVAMAARTDKLIELSMAQKNWDTKSEQYRAAISKFSATVEMLTQQEIDVQEAKDSAQAAFNQVLGALGGVATSAGIMLPLMVP